MTEIFNRLSELDEMTMGLDPEHPADLDELHRIADEMDHLEDLLDEINHIEWQNCEHGI